MDSEKARRFKAKLPQQLVSDIQTVINMIPCMDEGEEAILWSMFLVAYQTGRTDHAADSLKSALVSWSPRVPQ